MNEERLRLPITNTDIAILVGNYVTCIPVCIVVGLFSLYHFWNLASNVSSASAVHTPCCG